MKKIQFFIALWATKAAQSLMKLLGKNATYLPGKIAVKFCKDFLAHLTPPKTVVAVTGTNGKTTVSNLIASILRENGYTITNNSFGSNIQAGVISALVEDTTIFGKPKKDIAILEVDERSSLLIYPYLKPDFLVCNNLMRDSVKRNAHTEFISYFIDRALPASTKLVLNADDLVTSSLGTLGQPRVHFGMEAEKPTTKPTQQVRDLVYCPKCGGVLEEEYVRYNHIGRFRCTQCGHASPTPDYVITAIDRENNTFTIRHHGQEQTYNLINDNLVNVYNFGSAISLLTELGLTYEQISKGFSQAEIVKTRFDEVTAGDLHITLLMAKGLNPMACSRCYDYVAKAPGKNKAALVLVDDIHENTGDSENICWLYDCDYTTFADPSINQVVFAGPRCRDHLLRAQIAGVDVNKIKIIDEAAKALDCFDPALSNDVYVLHDLYQPKEAAFIKSTLIKMGNKEV